MAVQLAPEAELSAMYEIKKGDEPIQKLIDHFHFISDHEKLKKFITLI